METSTPLRRAVSLAVLSLAAGLIGASAAHAEDKAAILGSLSVFLTLQMLEFLWVFVLGLMRNFVRSAVTTAVNGLKRNR